jgi:hypothetical protein
MEGFSTMIFLGIFARRSSIDSDGASRARVGASFPDQTQKQVFGFDRGAPALTCNETGEKDNTPSRLIISLEHMPPGKMAPTVSL